MIVISENNGDKTVPAMHHPQIVKDDSIALPQLVRHLGCSLSTWSEWMSWRHIVDIVYVCKMHHMFGAVAETVEQLEGSGGI